MKPQDNPNFKKFLAASGLASIPYVTEETLTVQAGFLVSEDGVNAIAATLNPSAKPEDLTALQAQLDAANGNLSTANANLLTANADLATTKTSLNSLTAELSTTKTSLATATTDAAAWKAKAIEYGAKAGDTKPIAVPGADAVDNDSDISAELDKLPHNQKADKYFN